MDSSAFNEVSALPASVPPVAPPTMDACAALRASRSCLARKALSEVNESAMGVNSVTCGGKSGSTDGRVYVM